MNIQIKDIFEKVLFEYDDEDNTLKSTVAEAVRQGVDLTSADLKNADLSYADLHGVCLGNAILKGANLKAANLENATLTNADFESADLTYANLHSTDLRFADFNYANLHKADLSNACLGRANLCNAKNVPYVPFDCPSEGSFIGWKKIYTYLEDYRGSFIVKLLIPEDAKRSSSTTRKCRCDKAKVLEIRNIENGYTIDELTNVSYRCCIYTVGEYVYPDSFDENRWRECSNGIHFFINRQDALDY
jgi:hypothetical protein